MFFQDRIGLVAGTLDLSHGFVQLRVKRLPVGGYLHHAMLTESVEKPFQNHFHAFDKRFSITAVLGVRDGPLEIINDGQQFFD